VAWPSLSTAVDATALHADRRTDLNTRVGWFVLRELHERTQSGRRVTCKKAVRYLIASLLSCSGLSTHSRRSRLNKAR
jgi:hypothetical protein